MAGFGLSTLLTLVFVGGITFIIAWRRPFPVLAALVLLVPFRDLSIRWMNASTRLSPDWVNAISRWWFIVILALLAVVVLQRIRSWTRVRKPVRLDAIVITFGLVILLAVVHTLISPNFSVAFTSLRGYLQPMAVFVIASAIRPTRGQLQTLLFLLLIVGIIMAAFEIWQVVGWNADDYREGGYLRQNGELVTPTIEVRGRDYIRPTSTVSGPNELGVDMLLLMLLALMGAFWLNGSMKLWTIALVPVFALGIILTFSRSAMLGMMAALLMSLLLMIRLWRAADDRRQEKLFTRGRLLAGGGLAAILAATLALSGAFQFIGRTLSNLTYEYHFVDSVEAAQFLIKHPSGVGMGLVEPKGALALIETEALYHVEGSLFQIGMEMGVWGLLAWCLFWSACFLRLWKVWIHLEDPVERIWLGAALTGWVGALVAFLFLPLMQSISLMVWLWFLLGLALQFDSRLSGAEHAPFAAAGMP